MVQVGNGVEKKELERVSHMHQYKHFETYRVGIE